MNPEKLNANPNTPQGISQTQKNLPNIGLWFTAPASWHWNSSALLIEFFPAIDRRTVTLFQLPAKHIFPSSAEVQIGQYDEMVWRVPRRRTRTLQQERRFPKWPGNLISMLSVRTYLKFLTQIVNDSTKREQWVAFYSTDMTRIIIRWADRSLLSMDWAKWRSDLSVHFWNNVSLILFMLSRRYVPFGVVLYSIWAPWPVSTRCWFLIRISKYGFTVLKLRLAWYTILVLFAPVKHMSRIWEKISCRLLFMVPLVAVRSMIVAWPRQELDL